jgi:uncharacterized phage protein gp47/JayE
MSFFYNYKNEKVYVRSNYSPKYYNELFLNLLESANEEELISHNENFESYIKNKQDISSFYIMTLSILADNIEDVYYDMNDVYLSDKIDNALGTDLDDIGAKIGCPRPQATRAGVELTFDLHTPYDISLVIPANTTVSSSKGISYYTTESVNVPIGETKVKAFALAINPGRRHRVPSGTLKVANGELRLADGTVVGMSVNNELSSSGGYDAYDDEEYRALLLDWVKSNIKGSKSAYEKYFANVDGLDSYKLVPNWNGITGSVKIVLDPGIPGQLNQCYDELMGSVCQFSEDIVLFPPDYVPINIYAVCDVDIDVINPYSSTEKDEIKSRIETAIKDYIDGNLYSVDRKEYMGMELGEDFIPYKLGVYISRKVPEVKNIGFKYPLSPIEISDEQLCRSNEITVEMGTVPSFKELDFDDTLDSDKVRLNYNKEVLGLDFNNDSVADVLTSYMK